MGRKINKGLVFGIVLVAVAIVFAVAMTMNISANGPEILAGQGITLITEPYIGRVIEVDSSKNIVWNSSTDPDPPIDLSSPYDAERLANGNTLITDYFMDRVIEINSSGDIKWEMTGLVYPVDAERLENGNTLITEPNNFRVIEVDSDGTIVWDSSTYPTTPIVLNLPQDAERLENGNTLITDTFNGRVIEVDSDGTIVWDNTDPALVLVNDPFDLILPWDAERIENDITLITETGLGRVIEVDRDYNIVVVKGGLFSPYDAERLANGNTLITEAFGPSGGRVIEVDSAGDIKWEKTGLVSPWDVERFVPPVADAGPDQVVVAGDECLAMVTLDGKASSHPIGHPLAYTWTDSFGEATGLNPTVPLSLGTHTIMLTVGDSHGGTDTDTVVITVNDTTPPVLTVPIDLNVEQTSREGTPVDIGLATATDNCNEEITITNDAPLVFPLDQTVITWMAKDDSDNVTTGIQEVTVEDTTPPTIIVPEDITAECNTAGGATGVNLGTANVFDLCDPDPTVTDDAPSTFPLGQTIVTWTATDSNGNSATEIQSVTIVDTTPPKITLAGQISENVGKGKIANKLTVRATDNCSEVIDLNIDKVEIYNNGGNLVKGEGVYEISGLDIFVYPRGSGWSICVTATASDTCGNSTTETICETLLK